MTLIYETPSFILESHNTPEVSREDGGHLVVSPKIPRVDRSELTPAEAIECTRLTIVAGQALVAAMAEIGIEIGRINYQDNGNWKPQFHIHLYGRAKSAKFQTFGNPIIPGNKPEYTPLNADDITRIVRAIEQIFMQEKFADAAWKLT